MEKQKINWDDLRVVYNVEKRIKDAISYMEQSQTSYVTYFIPTLKKVLEVINEERFNYFKSLEEK